MQLPVELRDAIARTLEGVSRKGLAERAERVSDLYRRGGGSALAIRDEADALAYVVTRMPATYGAVRNVLERLRERCAEFAPRSILDLGAGPGTASWAAVDAWPEIESVTQADHNLALLRLGGALAASSSSPALRDARQVSADIAAALPPASVADLVVAGYTLAELDRTQSGSLIAAAWEQCAGALILVEPGTPGGYRRILQARELLLARGARVAAPCPHELACPLSAGDWCHFPQRIARSRDHMLLKHAGVPYEDEKFSYLAAVREAIFDPATADRVLAQPRLAGAGLGMKLCRRDGTAGLVQIAKRDAQAFHRAKKTNWGDAF